MDCPTSLNSQIVTSVAPSISNYSNMMQQQASVIAPNSFVRRTQLVEIKNRAMLTTRPADGCGNLQFNSPGLIFNSANGTMTFPGGPPMVNGTANHHYAQMMPQVYPMNAVPIAVAALSRGPPHTSHSPSVLSPQIVKHETANSQNGYAHLSSPPSVTSQQHGTQIEHQQFPNVYQAYRNMHSSSSRLPHPGQQTSKLPHPGQQTQQTMTENCRQHEATTLPQKLLSTSKSIVSISSNSADSQTRNPNGPSQHANDIQVQSSVPSAGNITQQAPGLVSQSTMTKEKILEQLQHSIYSSACNATMKAQHKLNVKRDNQTKRDANTNVKIENDENDTKDTTNISLLGVNNTKPTTSYNATSINSTSMTYIAPQQTSMKRKLSFGKLLTNNASVLNVSGDQSASKHKYVRVIGGRDNTKTESTLPISPHEFLKKLLISRGYATKHYCSLEGGYYCRPTPLQCASYGTKTVQAVRKSDKKLFAGLISSGLSRNPCNKFGESILHMVCRRGDHEILKLLMDNGATVQVSDDFGRTPLHDACWTCKPCFKSIEMILEKDIHLLHIVDCRGSPPLEYVKRENWREWNEFFEKQKEVFWPQRSLDEDNEEAPPQLVNIPPHSKPIADPENCASVELAAMFANGKKEPLCPT